MERGACESPGAGSTLQGHLEVSPLFWPIWLPRQYRLLGKHCFCQRSHFASGMSSPAAFPSEAWAWTPSPLRGLSTFHGAEPCAEWPPTRSRCSCSRSLHPRRSPGRAGRYLLTKECAVIQDSLRSEQRPQLSSPPGMTSVSAAGRSGFLFTGH